jgi:hypothetical protein
MSQLTVTPAASRQTATPGVSHQTARLLTAGIVAGPLFLAVWAPQAFTRHGFDPGRHPLSLLRSPSNPWPHDKGILLSGWGPVHLRCPSPSRVPGWRV